MKFYLDILISSSLLILLNEIGQLSALQLHDLVHDFCLIEARKEKLIEQTSSSAPSASSDLTSRIVTIDCNNKFFELNNFVLFGPNKKRYSGKHLYSLRINGDRLDNHLSYSFLLRNLRLLRVLRLSCIWRDLFCLCYSIVWVFPQGIRGIIMTLSYELIKTSYNESDDVRFESVLKNYSYWYRVIVWVIFWAILLAICIIWKMMV